jgi:hypothetical protein
LIAEFLISSLEPVVGLYGNLKWPQSEEYMDKDTPVAKVILTPGSTIPPPVIVDLGSRSKKAINKLKDGQGKLMYEVELAVEQARLTLSDSDKNKQVIPVIVIYRKKRKSVRDFPLNPLSAFSPLNFLR